MQPYEYGRAEYNTTLRENMRQIKFLNICVKEEWRGIHTRNCWNPKIQEISQEPVLLYFVPRVVFPSACLHTSSCRIRDEWGWVGGAVHGEPEGDLCRGGVGAVSAPRPGTV